jgi:hypothetical protein
MSSTTTKVLAGCGVGCLLALLALGGLGWMGYRWARTAAEVVEAAERAEDQLEAEYGLTRDYRPPTDGRVRDDRMEAFLKVRDLMGPERDALAATIDALKPSDGEGRAVGGFRTMRSVVGMPPRILEFARSRNEALLEVEMGQGEYAWIYWLTYHAWLGHPVGESLLQDYMEARDEEFENMEMHIDGMDEGRARNQLRGDIGAMLENLRDDLAAAADDSELLDLITAELTQLGADFDRVPWQDGVPERLLDGLEPYRDRLEASYSPATNPFELVELDSGPQGVRVH